MKARLTHPIFKVVSDCAEEMNLQAFVIGGWVRDALLNRPCKDIDFVCLGSGIELAENVSKKLGAGYQVSVYKNFGTATIKLPPNAASEYEGFDIEFVGARKESYS